MQAAASHFNMQKDTTFPFSFHSQPQTETELFAAEIMENWANRLNCRMEDEPWHLPVSHNMHTQPWVTTRRFNHTQSCAQVMGNYHTTGAYLNWKSPSTLMPECQGPEGSAMPPVFVGAPLDKGKRDLLLDLAKIVSIQTAIAPFARVQLLMQNQNALIQSGRLSQPYKGIFNCYARTIRNGGFISLWRGNTARVTAGCSHKVISFALFSYAKSQGVHNWDYGAILALSGCIYAASLFVHYPLTYAGTRLSNDIKTTCKDSKWQFNGIVDVFRKTLKSDGIVGLYRGCIIGTIESDMTSIANKRLYDALKSKEILQFLGLQKHLLARSIVVWGVEACTVVATYPMDTVNKRMMMTSGEAVKYKNTSDAFAQILKNEGLKSFYKGAGAEIVRLGAISGVRLLGLYLLGASILRKDERSHYNIRWRKSKKEQV